MAAGASPQREREYEEPKRASQQWSLREYRRLSISQLAAILDDLQARKARDKETSQAQHNGGRTPRAIKKTRSDR